MNMCALSSELFTKSDTAFVHKARVPSSRRRYARWKDADAIRTSEPSWSVCVAYASEIEPWNGPDLSDTGWAGLSVSTGNNSNLLVC
jgi:hypothetical protein